VSSLLRVCPSSNPMIRATGSCEPTTGVGLRLARPSRSHPVEAVSRQYRVGDASFAVTRWLGFRVTRGAGRTAPVPAFASSSATRRPALPALGILAASELTFSSAAGDDRIS
jgi:hypothetical protein